MPSTKESIGGLYQSLTYMSLYLHVEPEKHPPAERHAVWHGVEVLANRLYKPSGRDNGLGLSDGYYDC